MAIIMLAYIIFYVIWIVRNLKMYQEKYEDGDYIRKFNILL